MAEIVSWVLDTELEMSQGNLGSVIWVDLEFIF